MEPQENLPSSKKIKLDFKDSKYATGRRKRSIARVWLKKGSGLIYINGKKINEYFKKTNLLISTVRPLTLTKRANEFDVKCTVKGGGLSGFTKREESEYDPFGAAHSSTSISSTLGMSVAKKLRVQNAPKFQGQGQGLRFFHFFLPFSRKKIHR